MHGQWPQWGERPERISTAAVSRCVRWSLVQNTVRPSKPRLSSQHFQLVRKSSFPKAHECQAGRSRFMGRPAAEQRFRLGQPFSRARSEIRAVSVSKLISVHPDAPSQADRLRRFSIRLEINRTEQVCAELCRRPRRWKRHLRAKGARYFSSEQGFSMVRQKQPRATVHSNRASSRPRMGNVIPNDNPLWMRGIGLACPILPSNWATEGRISLRPPFFPERVASTAGATRISIKTLNVA